MATNTTYSGQVNTTQFGGGQFGQLVTTVSQVPTVPTTGLRRSQNGFMHAGERQYGRSYLYTLRASTPSAGTSTPTISLISSSGAILGTIRSDTAKTLIRDVQFTNVRGDCRDFKITLNRPPSFPILKFSFVKIKLANSSFGWYYGRIKEAPELSDDNRSEYVYSGVGLSEYVSKITGNGRSYTALTDVGEIVYDLAHNVIDVETPILIDDNLIEQNTGVPISGTITLDKSSIKKALDTFANMSGCDWGVNGDGTFFFQRKVTSIVKTWFVGYNLHEIKINPNTDSVRNRIVGTRTSLTGSGTPGWVVGAISIDQKSQNKYGTIEETFQFPGNISNSDMQLVTDALLANKKEPSTSCISTSFKIETTSDFIRRGVSKFIMPYDSYEVEYQSCDDPVTDFTKFGSGDLTRSQDPVNFIDGQNSMRLQWTSAVNDYVSMTSTLVANLKKIRFYYRSSKAGTIARVGIGWGVWNQYTKNIMIPIAAIDTWVPFEWDISAENIRRISMFGIQILDTGAGSINIDRVTFNAEGFRHLELSNEKQTYIISPDQLSIRMENGSIMPRLENYIAGLYALTEESKFSGEIK